jgi:choline dehydrogenase-like flavoprotein
VIANAAAGAPGLTTTLCRGGPLADDRHYDLIIVGPEAGGEALAHGPPRGTHVCLLERGHDLPGDRGDWSSTAVFVHAIGADVLRPTAGRTAPDPAAIPGRRRTPVAAWADEGGRAAP